MIGQLEVIVGPDKGRVFPVDNGQIIHIGRGSQTPTKLADPYVSRQHCRVEAADGMLKLFDLGSAAGTRVNGEKVHEAVLMPGDVIAVGNTQIRVEMVGFHEEATFRGTLPPHSVAVDDADVTRVADLAQLVGRRFGGYRIEQLLAQGQTSFVFKAKEIAGDRPVALKVLLPHLAERSEIVERFLQSMHVIEKIKHPNLVEVYHADRSGPYCYMAMELVEGQSLKQIIDGIGMFGILDWRYALRVAVHVARALAFAKSQAILHRNIAPKNILIRQADKVAKLGDMMLAKVFDSIDSQQVSIRGQLSADLAYSAPERNSADPRADSRTDLYELAATIYALLTGGPPCAGANPLDTLHKIQNVVPPSTKSVQLSVPDAFDRLLLQTLAKRPEDRPQNPADFVATLERVAREHDLAVD